MAVSAGRAWRHGWPAGVSVLLGVAVSVLVNVWTGSWAWPAGAGLAVLALTWVVAEVIRSDDRSTGAGVRVRQHAAIVTRSKLEGYRGSMPGSHALDVHQDFGVVEDSTVVGIAGIPGASSDTAQGSQIRGHDAQ
jgi:hypothetical protein